MGLRDWAQNRLIAKNAKSVTIRDDEIIFGRVRRPLKGARAAVDTAGALEKRVTATRLILTGPLAFGLRKKKDSRELYLYMSRATDLPSLQSLIRSTALPLVSSPLASMPWGSRQPSMPNPRTQRPLLSIVLTGCTN